MRPNERTKNGQKGAHEFNCKIFVIFEAIYDIYDKNYSRKKINDSSTILIFLPLNHLRHFGIFDLLGFVGAIQFSVEEIKWDAKSFKKFLKVRWGQKLIFCNFRVFESHLLKILQIFVIICCVSLLQRSRKHTSLRLLRKFSNKLIRK